MSAAAQGTANDRFKARSGRRIWIAGIVTLVAHALVLLFVPPIQVQGSSSRMVVHVGPWSGLRGIESIPAAYVAFDTTVVPPRLRNRTAVNHRLPRMYPWIMWHHKEPSSALIEVTITRSGHVRRAALVRHLDNGAETALLGAAQLMRFELADLPDGIAGIVAAVEIAVAEPDPR